LMSLQDTVWKDIANSSDGVYRHGEFG